MNGFIVGNDISNYQGEIDYGTYQKNTNFVIMKATEGLAYIDTWFGNNRSQARKYNIPLGYYHFARPDQGNRAIEEADFFLKMLSGDPIREGEVIVLDYEVGYSDPVGWCKAWLDHVSAQLNGIKPLLYLNQSLIRTYDWSPVANADYGLYVADYTYNPINNDFFTGAWQSAAMQQWTDKQVVPGIQGGVDGDVFFGTVEQFKSYGYKAPAPVVTPPVVPTPPPVIPPVPPVVPVEPPVVIKPPVTPHTDPRYAKEAQIAVILASHLSWWTKFKRIMAIIR